MTMSLTQARARVRFIIDDPSPGVIASDADIDDALTTAQQEVYGIITASSNLVQTTGLVSTANDGTASLTALAPKKVCGVAIVQGLMRVQVPPLRAAQMQYRYTAVESLELVYVPRVTFPSAPGNNFVWGSAALDIPVADKLMCMVAASEIKIVDAEVLDGIENRKMELQTAINALINVPSWSVLPLGPQNMQPFLRHIMTGFDTLALCYA